MPMRASHNAAARSNGRRLFPEPIPLERQTGTASQPFRAASSLALPPHPIVAGFCCTVLFVAIATGCAGCAATPKEAPVELTLTLNATTYRIGEPVLATVRFSNGSAGAEGAAPTIMVPALDENTLRFHVAERGSLVRARRSPVLPARTEPEAHMLAPGESASRTFLFTQLTAAPGDRALQVALSGCESQGGTVEVMPTYYSRLAAYHVSDQVMFQRDPNSGLITREQALALAEEHAAKAGPEPSGAVLVPLGNTGLYEWAIYTGDEKDWLKAGPAFMVNPYSGAVENPDARETGEEGGKG